MENSIFNLQCASLEELDKALTAPREEKVSLVALNLYGPQILVRQFDLPLSSSREITNALKLEAAEVFSLLPEEIEIDYQALASLKDKTKGVFIGIPKKLLGVYISYFNKNRITAEKITANIFSRLNYFLHENKIKNGCFCIIDFFKEGIVNLVILDKGECVLLREIYYENLNDAEKEIGYSLKYAVSKSTYKKFDGVYALGDLLNKDNLILNLGKDLNAGIKKYNNIDIRQLNISSPDLFFNLNLIRKYAFSQAARQKILYTTNAVLAICLVFFLVLSIKIIRQDKRIKDLSASYNAKEYKYAVSLQEKLALLKNAQ